MNSSARHRNAPLSAGMQRGAALVTGLIILLVLMILGVAIVRVSTMQERMARNMRDQSISFQAAEVALRSAEARIKAGGAPFRPVVRSQFTAACSNARCIPSTTSTPRWDSVSWAAVSTETAEVATLTLPAGVAKPRYMIEVLAAPPGDLSAGSGGPKSCSVDFRITARGFGPNGAVTRLQSLYRTRTNSVSAC